MGWSKLFSKKASLAETPKLLAETPNLLRISFPKLSL